MISWTSVLHVGLCCVGFGLAIYSALRAADDLDDELGDGCHLDYGCYVVEACRRYPAIPYLAGVSVGHAIWSVLSL